MTLSLLLALLLPRAEARCADRYVSDDLLRTARVALEDYGQGRLSGFHSANALAWELVPCFDELVRPDAVARWYVVLGVQAFLDRDQSAVLRYFQMARFLDPTYGCDDTLGPVGHPLRLACEQASLAPPFGERPFEGKVRGALFIDGLEASALPAERPFVAQVIAPDGDVRRTWFVQDALPDMLSGERESRWSRRLAIGSMGSAMLAAGLWAGVARGVDGYFDLAVDVGRTEGMGPPEAEQQARRAATGVNALGIGAQVSSGLALGLGVSALVVKF